MSQPGTEPRTTARLRADIDDGSRGDKVDAFDPAAAPLGTDDEAAGDPPSQFRVGLAEETETGPAVVLDEEDRGGWAVYLLVAGAILAGCVALFAVFS
jgi:hypothetical protein